ncbi:MAG TPA: hypothetical protein ENK97_03535 [Campylobacteraceae bacterium]|nr:hypothetical protein [Campylobacteraceae bacterium]
MQLFNSLWETILYAFIFVTLLYFLSDAIVIRLDSYHDLALLFLALITLYNGTLYGVIALAVIAGGIYFFTLEYDTDTILEYLVFVLLFGEFQFHFRHRGRQDHEEKNYLKAKFRELSNAFYALKVSHDQLEKGYLLKPVTLRSLLIELAKAHTLKDIYTRLFTTFTEAFSLKSALYCELTEDASLKQSVKLGESHFTFDPKHPMIAQVIATKKPLFLSEEEMEMLQDEPILAVLPVLDTRNRLLGLFVIEEMDFLAFHMDNILKIEILLEYLAQERFYNTHQAHFSVHLSLPDIDAKFQLEIDRLYTMQQRFGVHSAVVTVHTADPAVALTLENFKTKKMRLLDQVDLHREAGAWFYIFLLPLERLSGAISFKERLEKELQIFGEERYHIIITEIDKIDTLGPWIRAHAV